MSKPETFEDIIRTEMLTEADDRDRDLYAIRVLYLNVNTGQRRSVILAPSYDRDHVERTLVRFGGMPEFLKTALRKEYPKSCPTHWTVIGLRTVRIAEIPF